MRLDGWESRLLAVVENARNEPYELGRHDCFSVSCACVNALTGINHWTEWKGRYRTKREALKLLIEYGGGFTESFTKLFGTNPVPMPFCRRGDIAQFVDPQGESHLGVCVGSNVVVLGEAGLGFIPASACARSWRIG